MILHSGFFNLTVEIKMKEIQYFLFLIVNIKSKNWMNGLNTKSIDDFDLIYLFNYKFGFMENKRGIILFFET